MVLDLDGVQVLVRGWLHGNCVLLPSAPTAIIDTGYHTGASAVVDAFEASGFDITDLTAVLLTHIHSDHAGGVAEIITRSGAAVLASMEADRLTGAWSPWALWIDEPMGQHMPRFHVDVVLRPGEVVPAGGLEWQVIDTPGHAMGGLSFYCAARKLLVSGDALWQQGFGLLNPWVDGPGVFDRAQVALDNLARLDVETVIPGHGPPFTGFAAALSRAQQRLSYFRSSPHRLRHQVVRNTAHFIRLAYPERPAEAHLARVRALAEVLTPLPQDTHRTSPEDLAVAVWKELT